MKTFLALLLAISTTALAQPKVEETVLGPVNVGGVFVVGADGHVACVGKKDARLVVTVDGVAGPEFDELFTSSGNSFFYPPQAAAWTTTLGGRDGGMSPVYFSLDGAHHAYAGRQGAEYVVVHDGKEIARGPKEKLNLRYGALSISPRGRHVYWVEAETVQGRMRVFPMVDGKPGPVSGPQPNTWNLAFSADESRHAYYAQSPDNNKPMLIVDGKDAGYAGRDPVFTADGKVLLCVNHEGGKASILANGKTAASGLVVEKIIRAPVGSHWAALVRTRVENGAGVSTFFLDGKEVPGTDGAKEVWFSADAKHYAVACVNNAARAMFMFVDGVKLREYPQVSQASWTSDGAKFIYQITAAGRKFVVANGEEFAVRDMVVPNGQITMAEAGDHYGYMTRDGMNQNFSVMINGKNVLPAGHFPYDHTLTFTPDGSRHAFFVGKVGRQAVDAIVVDGELRHSGMLPALFSKWVSSELVQPSVVLSRDGKHFACWLRGGPDAKARGIYVDGKRVFAERRVLYFPTFTPDSRHFFWLADEPAEVRGQPPLTGVYVDGQRAVHANGYFFSQMPGAWSMDRDGTVTFLAAHGTVAKRYRITAPADTSVETLLALAKLD